MRLRWRAANSPWQKSPLHSTGVASRLTALLVGCIWPICALLTPCQPGATPVSVRRGAFTTGCYRPGTRVHFRADRALRTAASTSSMPRRPSSTVGKSSASGSGGTPASRARMVSQALA